MMSRRLLLGAAACVAAGTVAAYTLWPMGQSAAGSPVFTGETDGVAINGYDPVAYFREHRPVEGRDEHTMTWKGVTWRFSSAENRDLFSGDPEKYAPQYGGYCAYAAANNAIAKTEPDAFTIYEGKLYLNYDQNIKSRWDGDRMRYVELADDYWPGLASSGTE